MRSLRVRLTVWRLMLVVAVVAIGLYPLKNPSLMAVGTLLYLTIGLVLYATFRARYGQGRAAAWWFGFAAFGWASLMLNASHVPTIDLHSFPTRSPYWEPFDLANMLGMHAWRVLPHDPSVNHHEYASIFRCWMTIAAALLGGFLCLLWCSPGVADTTSAMSRPPGVPQP